MKRFITEHVGYFDSADLKAMQAEFDAGATPGETREDQAERAHRIFMKYQARSSRPVPAEGTGDATACRP